jgi:hypothetical protein
MRFESSAISQSILFVLMTVAGTLLVTSTFETALTEAVIMSTNSLPEFILGMVLIVTAFIGAWGRSSREVIIDREVNAIIIHDRVFAKRSEETIPFSSIQRFTVSQFGSVLSGRRFSVVLVCHDNREVPLFWPAYFKGSSKRSSMENVRIDIERVVFEQA